MSMLKKCHSRILFFILINTFLYPSIVSLLRNMKEISDKGDYFVVLDSGLYIYNFENSKRKTIATLNSSIFKTKEEDNRIVISKNEDSFSNETKIATLINQHLYIYTYGNSITNLEYLLIKNFTRSLYKTFPFEIQINGYNLNIFFSLTDNAYNSIYIKTFFFQNYSSIQIDEPKEISSDLIDANSPICQIDKKDSLIKCVCQYNSWYLIFLILKKKEDNFEKIFDKRIYNYDYSEDIIPLYMPNRISNVTWLISTKTLNVTLVCCIERDISICFYSNMTDKIYFRDFYLNYNRMQCSELNTYFFEEKNQFVISSKISNNSYIFHILDGNNLNIIQKKNITIDDYNGKYTMIYNHRTNNYDLVNIYLVEEISEDNISTEEITEINTYKISQNTFKQTDEISNKEIKTKSMNIYSDIYSDISFNYFCQNIEEIGKSKIENELIIPCDYYMIKFTSTYFQKKYYYNNTSIIDLGKCEEDLKNYYKISNTSILYILMIIFNFKGINHPIIEYEILYPNENGTMEKLNLSICDNIKIELFIPVNITDNIDKHNPNSSYYNDICTKATSESGTDIIIEDRRNEFVDNNMSLCEDNCTFIDYDNNNKKAKCSCEVKTFFSFINEIKIDKNKLMKNFKDINTITNIQIIKCYKIAFIKGNIIKNYGFYILSFIFLFCFICTILFYSKFYESLIKEVESIISDLKNSLSKDDINKNKIKSKKRKDEIEKEEVKSDIEMSFIKNKRRNRRKNKDDVKSNIETNLQKNKRRKNKKEINEEIKSNIEKNSMINKKRKEKKKKVKMLIIENEEDNQIKKSMKNKKKKLVTFDESHKRIKSNNLNIENIEVKDKEILEYNEFELNSLSYKEALTIDKRTFFQFYFSLLKKNQLLLFSFYPNKDYNSIIIKIFLFFFFFSSHITINALFFTDSSMHKIYIDEGSFNINYQIPQIVYSTLISSVINAIIKFLSLSEKKVIELKKIKDITIIDDKFKEILKILKIKFICFYLLAFILLSCFWFYIICFCGIYVNTQIFLIKDSIISFCISFLYPFAIYLIPAIFRKCSLKTKKGDKECLYKFSNLF